jgi:hypothetical protein
MVRSVISAALFAVTFGLASIGGAVMPATADAHASSDSGNLNAGADPAVQLVTQEELCAFRAPVLLNADTVPIVCLPTVEWLRRVINADMQCGDLWLQRGAIPECAQPYR